MSHVAISWIFLIPVVAIVGGLVVGAIAIAIVTEHRRKQALLDERRLMIEKGLTPPPLTEHALDSVIEAGALVSVIGIGNLVYFWIANRRAVAKT